MKVDTNNEAALDAVVGLLSEHDTMILATSERGQPWTSGVFFAHEITTGGKLVLYATMLQGSRKVDTLQRNPKVVSTLARVSHRAGSRARGAQW